MQEKCTGKVVSMKQNKDQAYARRDWLKSKSERPTNRRSISAIGQGECIMIISIALVAVLLVADVIFS